MNRPKAFTMAVACALLIASHAAAEEAQKRDQNTEWMQADFPAQLEALRDQLARSGMALSDVRVQMNTGESARRDQPESGCTVSRSVFEDEGLKPVHLEASAPTCTEAWALLEGS